MSPSALSNFSCQNLNLDLPSSDSISGRTIFISITGCLLLFVFSRWQICCLSYRAEALTMFTLRCLIKWEGCLLDKPKLADRFELFSLNRWPRKSALLFEPPLFITFSFSVSYILRFASETVLRYVGQLSAYIAHHFTNYFYFLVLWKDWHFTLNRPNLLEISCAFFKCSLIFSHQIVELASRCFLHRN